MQWLDIGISNQCRTDFGYYFNGRHFYRGDADYDVSRAVGVGTDSGLHQRRQQQSTESARGITMSSTDFATIIENVAGTVQKGVNAGVNTTLRSAAALANIMVPQQSMVEGNTTRSFHPVPHTNNVMVSITNPGADVSTGK